MTIHTFTAMQKTGTAAVGFKREKFHPLLTAGMPAEHFFIDADEPLGRVLDNETDRNVNSIPSLYNNAGTIAARADRIWTLGAGHSKAKHVVSALDGRNPGRATTAGAFEFFGGALLANSVYYLTGAGVPTDFSAGVTFAFLVKRHANAAGHYAAGVSPYLQFPGYKSGGNTYTTYIGCYGTTADAGQTLAFAGQRSGPRTAGDNSEVSVWAVGEWEIHMVKVSAAGIALASNQGNVGAIGALFNQYATYMALGGAYNTNDMAFTGQIKVGGAWPNTMTADQEQKLWAYLALRGGFYRGAGAGALDILPTSNPHFAAPGPRA